MLYFQKLPAKKQYAVSLISVSVVAMACFFAKELLNYKIVALLLLMTVSVIAMLFDIKPVLLAATISAVTWNFFFIPPLYTFHISDTQDLLMFLLYFVLAMVHAVLSFKIREAEKKSRDKDEKEKEIRLYNTLLNSLSHELRTPIATIIGSVDTLKENTDKLSNQNKNDLLCEIETASLRLNRQVENILHMSRLESGILKPNADWCDMNELIYAVIRKINASPGHNIVFKPDESLPLFKLDAGFTELIIFNLLYNAVQYTAENTGIFIDVSLQQGNCIIVVSDNGTGFPEKELGHVFDKFYRLPNSKAGGTGLGLSIVKGFVEAQNGTVTLENNQQGGARFTISIPAETTYINNLKNE